MDIELNINEQEISSNSEVADVAKGTKNYFKCKFNLESESWKDLDFCNAIFTSIKATEIVSLGDTKTSNVKECFIPSECLASEGGVYVALNGTKVNEEEIVYRITTIDKKILSIREEIL